MDTAGTLVPPAWFRLQGEKSDYYGIEFGLALMMAIVIGTLAGAAGITARFMIGFRFRQG